MNRDTEFPTNQNAMLRLSPNTSRYQDKNDVNACKHTPATPSSSATVPKLRVNFHSALVTSVNFRPLTIEAEKATLYYTRVDFRRFKMDFRREKFCSGTMRHGTNSRTEMNTYARRVVRFTPLMVTGMMQVPARSDMDEAERRRRFYSKKDLRRFLEDYIACPISEIGDEDVPEAGETIPKIDEPRRGSHDHVENCFIATPQKAAAPNKQQTSSDNSYAEEEKVTLQPAPACVKPAKPQWSDSFVVQQRDRPVRRSPSAAPMRSMRHDRDAFAYRQREGFRCVGPNTAPRLEGRNQSGFATQMIEARAA